MTSFGSDLILARLRGLHPKAIDLSLSRIERLLGALRHPERRLPPVVHIAGTNGKGSVLAMLDAMLQAAGRRVQRYISPHLVHYGERFLFDGQPIADLELADVLDLCERANRGQPITEFEITTAAAFLAFERCPADLLLMETGLGGRLDATNVIARPNLTTLSPISLDHQTFLGETLGQIAFEKAGILKPGVLCVVGPQPAEALRTIQTRAAEIGAPLRLHGRDWMAKRVDDRLLVTVGADELELPLPALPGCHQVDNAGLAVACALELGGLAPDPPSIARGLLEASWPARLQRLSSGPLAQMLPEGAELRLDGGHNPAAAEALAASMSQDHDPLHLVVGMLNSKELIGFLAPLAPITSTLRAVSVPGEAASREPQEIAGAALQLGIPATAAKDVSSAIGQIAAEEKPPYRVLICGSLYLAGHVLRENG